MALDPLFEANYNIFVTADIPSVQKDTLSASPESIARLAAENTGKDILFNFETGEFDLKQGDLQLAKSYTYIEQSAKIHLQLIAEEWFADQNLGIPYYEQILIKSPFEVVVKNILSTELKAVQGVTLVKDVAYSLDTTTRLLKIDSWDLITDTLELSKGVF
jgi:hypothetical protein